GIRDKLVTGVQTCALPIYQIQATATKGKAPTVLYEEPELTVRVVRDLFTDEEYRGLVTDSQRVDGLVVNYLREVAPDLAEKVTRSEERRVGKGCRCRESSF